MNDWLEVMLDEIERKKQESEEALDELRRRSGDGATAGTEAPVRQLPLPDTQDVASK